MTTQAVAHPVPHLLSVRDFYKMGEVGILGPDDRVELIEGALIDMAPIGSPHAGMVTRLTNLFAQLLAGRAVLSPQNPVRLGEHSEPQPDLTVLRAREDFYADAHPEPADVLLLIEVADTSVRFDRETKVPLYARHGIPEVWLIDLNARRVEVHRGPMGGAYRERRFPENTETLGPALLPDVAIALGALWT